jgi:NAD(P)-dependent dehydrogenase (short-subunit alcohol dehydrogenase family)
MQDSTIVIFGGSSGVGEVTARLLAERGASIVIVGRDAEKLEAARQRIGRDVTAARVDATDRAAVDRFFAERERVDHLILCQSGGKGAGPFRALSLDDVRSGFEAKFFAQVGVAQAALPKLRPDGSITFVTAASARAAVRGTAGLGAINAAIEAVARTLALELAPLRVNAVSPGVIDTPWWERMPREAKDAFFQQAAENLPVRRVGKPEDVAAAIALLVDNGFMTGTVLEVDGGARLARG